MGTLLLINLNKPENQTTLLEVASEQIYRGPLIHSSLPVTTQYSRGLRVTGEGHNTRLHLKTQTVAYL